MVQCLLSYNYPSNFQQIIFFLTHIILLVVYKFMLLNIRPTSSMLLFFFCPEIWKRKLRLQNKGICFRFAALLGAFLHFFGKLGVCYYLLWYYRLGQERLTAYWFAWNPSATSVSQLLDAVVVMNALQTSNNSNHIAATWWGKE